jgi:hypothetical protein
MSWLQKPEPSIFVCDRTLPVRIGKTRVWKLTAEALRQGEHNDIIAIGILAKSLVEQATHFGSISKWKYSFSQEFISGIQVRAGDSSMLHLVAEPR